MATRQAAGSLRIGELQAQQQRDEFRIGLRALLMEPLMIPTHEDFPAVRRQADKLRDWFSREAGWPLQVEREGARLYKRPGDLVDATRGLKDFDRRRYVLLCARRGARAFHVGHCRRPGDHRPAAARAGHRTRGR